MNKDNSTVYQPIKHTPEPWNQTSGSNFSDLYTPATPSALKKALAGWLWAILAVVIFVGLTYLLS